MTTTSSCQVTYTPSAVGSGSHNIGASYGGSALHAMSSDPDGFDVTVTKRSTSTALSCIPLVQQVGQNISCTATVTDTETNGSKSDPSGTVNFTRNGSPGGSCTLVSDGNSATFTSSCSVTYTSSVATVDSIVATYAGSNVHAGSTSDPILIVFYDPNGGFVTGGGWINSPFGAYVPSPSLAGRANFGFVSKYQKGATVPTGETEFQFQVGNFNFHSTSYQWLVISGYKAQYKGYGTVNGSGNYGFLLTAYDSQLTGGGGTDKFRIKIWVVGGSVVYDNVLAASDDIDAAYPTAVAGGSIVIHKGK